MFLLNIMEQLLNVVICNADNVDLSSLAILSCCSTYLRDCAYFQRRITCKKLLEKSGLVFIKESVHPRKTCEKCGSNTSNKCPFTMKPLCSISCTNYVSKTEAKKMYRFKDEDLVHINSLVAWHNLYKIDITMYYAKNLIELCIAKYGSSTPKPKEMSKAKKKRDEVFDTFCKDIREPALFIKIPVVDRYMKNGRGGARLIKECVGKWGGYLKCIDDLPPIQRKMLSLDDIPSYFGVTYHGLPGEYLKDMLQMRELKHDRIDKVI